MSEERRDASRRPGPRRSTRGEPSRAPAYQAASGRANSNSVTISGCTSTTGARNRRTACRPNPPTDVARPISHPRSANQAHQQGGADLGGRLGDAARRASARRSRSRTRQRRPARMAPPPRCSPRLAIADSIARSTGADYSCRKSARALCRTRRTAPGRVRRSGRCGAASVRSTSAYMSIASFVTPSTSGGDRDQPSAERVDLVEERLGGEDVVHQADRERAFGVDSHAGHRDVLRPRRSDQPGEPAGAAASGHHSDVDLGQPELRVRRAEPEVARHRHLDAGAERDALARR